MKSFIRTIAVSVALALVTVSFGDVEAIGQEAEEVRREMRRAKMEMDLAGRKMKEASRRLAAVTPTIEIQMPDVSKVLSTVLARYGSESSRVLVIPTDEIKPKELPMIMEDVDIMARIFDKRLDVADLGLEDYDWWCGDDFLEWNVPVTKGIFIEGYGVLFLKKVDFPLSPAAEPKKIEEIEGDFDPVWEKTKRRMYSRDKAFRRRHRRSDEEYEPEKVEILKKTLIRSLKHASNIRNLDPGDWVVVTVIGVAAESEEVRIMRELEFDDEKVIEHYEDLLEDEEEGGVSGPTVLTLRVKKSDVDAFSKGRTKFEQFSKQVKIVAYRYRTGYVGYGRTTTRRGRPERPAGPR